MTAEPEDGAGNSGTGGSRPRGRGRPPTIDPEELLEVARTVFLEKGFRATTQEVAERAGVSEGSIFHRFGTKEALFRRAMNLDAGELLAQVEATLRTIEPLPVEEALNQLGQRLLQIGRVNIPLMMMSWSNPEACTEAAQAQKHVAYKQLFYGLIGYFDRQRQKGTLRAVDTEVLARTFVGAIHHYCMVRVINPGTDYLMVPEAIYLRGLLDLILRGALPAPAPHS